jgi:hypothetical protein
MLKDRRYASVNSHPAAETRRVLREFGFHLLQVTHDDPGMPQKRLCGSGWFETLRGSMKERRLHEIFKIGDSLADRGGCNMLSAAAREMLLLSQTATNNFKDKRSKRISRHSERTAKPAEWPADRGEPPGGGSRQDLGCVDEFWRDDVFGIPELNQT